MKKFVYTIFLILTSLMAIAQDGPPSGATAISPNFTWYKKIVAGDTSIYGYSNNNWVNFARRNWVKTLLNGKANLNGGNVFSGTQTLNNSQLILTGAGSTQTTFQQQTGELWITDGVGGGITSIKNGRVYLRDGEGTLLPYTTAPDVTTIGDARYARLTGGNLISGDQTYYNKVYLHGDAVDALEPITKNQFDNFMTGASWKQEVRVSTTANISLSGTQTIDTVNVLVNDRVLVRFQTNQTQNGIYVVKSAAWIRALDADSPSELYKNTVLVRTGKQYKATVWTCSNSDEPVIGTDPITYGQMSGVGTYINGLGLTLFGNRFDINYTTLDGRYAKLSGGNAFTGYQTINGELNITGAVGAAYYRTSVQAGTLTPGDVDFANIKVSASNVGPFLGVATYRDSVADFRAGSAAGGATYSIERNNAGTWVPMVQFDASGLIGYWKLNADNTSTGLQTVGNGATTSTIFNNAIRAIGTNAQVVSQSLGGLDYTTLQTDYIYVSKNFGEKTATLNSSSLGFNSGLFLDANGITFNKVAIIPTQPTTGDPGQGVAFFTPDKPRGTSYTLATTADITNYTNGTGLFLTGNTFSLNQTFTQGLFSATSPLLYNNTTGQFSIQAATTSQNGYLTSANWNTFNNKEVPLTFSSGVIRTTNTITLDQSFAANWTGLQTFSANGIGASLTDRVLLANNTLSTSGAPIQLAPALHFKGNARETTGGTNTSQEAYLQQVLTSAANAGQYMSMLFANNGGAVVERFRFTGDGFFYGANGFALGGTSYFAPQALLDIKQIQDNNSGGWRVTNISGGGSLRGSVDGSGYSHLDGNSSGAMPVIINGAGVGQLIINATGPNGTAARLQVGGPISATATAYSTGGTSLLGINTTTNLFEKVNATNAGLMPLINSQTTLTGATSGTAVASMPFQTAAYKKVIISLAGYVGTSTYTFPTAFTVATSSLITLPQTTGGTGVTSYSSNATTFTFTVGAGGSTGYILIEGY